MIRLLHWLIRFYQIAISPLIGPRCRYIPTCSQYSLEAIHTHGALKGMLDIQTTLMVLGGLVVIAASCVLMIRFSVEHKEKEQKLFEAAVLERNSMEQNAVSLKQNSAT